MNLGSLAWMEATSGRLTAADRRAFLGPAARQTARFTVGRLRLALGLRGTGGVDLDGVLLPDSAVARRAEEEARETLGEAVLGHSWRTFWFGLALAELDGRTIDLEELYVGALLHDIALESPSPTGCFAVRGGRRARELVLESGGDEALADRIAVGIAHHITPGCGQEHGPLAPLIQGGAMVDLTGDRLWELREDFASTVVARHPRHDLKRHVSACWKTEAKLFPEGRAAWLERVASFSLLVRLAPW